MSRRSQTSCNTLISQVSDKDGEKTRMNVWSTPMYDNALTYTLVPLECHVLNIFQSFSFFLSFLALVHSYLCALSSCGQLIVPPKLHHWSTWCLSKQKLCKVNWEMLVGNWEMLVGNWEMLVGEVGLISSVSGSMLKVKLSSRSSVVWGWGRLQVWKRKKVLGVWSQDLSSLLPILAAAATLTTTESSPDL